MWEQIRRNKRNSFILIICMAILLVLIGMSFGLYLFGNIKIGIFIGLFIWIIMALISYYSGGNILLSMHNSKKINRNNFPMLINVVEEMKIASGLTSMPEVYVIEDDAPNAFATGRNPETSAVAVTTGLLEKLNRDELQAVLAHEIGHIINRDTLYMTMVGVMLGAIVLLSDIALRSFIWTGGGRRSRSSSDDDSNNGVFAIIALVLVIISPIIGQFIYFAISRKREYMADACSAIYTRYPAALASALEKISRTTYKLQGASKATAGMYIINPFLTGPQKLSDLSSTHPPIKERIKILLSMSGEASVASYNNVFSKITGNKNKIISDKLYVNNKFKRKKTETPVTQKKVETNISKREIRDLPLSLKNYIFITCECGTKIKIPPSLKNRRIRCIHCGKMHQT